MADSILLFLFVLGWGVGTCRHNKDSVVNLMLARECEFFVGTMSSNWSRMVLELMAIMQSPNEDFTKWSSLDDNWYNNP